MKVFIVTVIYNFILSSLLCIDRSLQRLNVPDWFKNSPAARDGFRLKRHSDASQHGGWRALGSKTTSLSSLSSTTNRQPTTGDNLESKKFFFFIFNQENLSIFRSRRLANKRILNFCL